MDLVGKNERAGMNTSEEAEAGKKKEKEKGALDEAEKELLRASYDEWAREKREKEGTKVGWSSSDKGKGKEEVQEGGRAELMEEGDVTMRVDAPGEGPAEGEGERDKPSSWTVQHVDVGEWLRELELLEWVHVVLSPPCCIP